MTRTQWPTPPALQAIKPFLHLQGCVFVLEMDREVGQLLDIALAGFSFDQLERFLRILDLEPFRKRRRESPLGVLSTDSVRNFFVESGSQGGQGRISSERKGAPPIDFYATALLEGETAIKTGPGFIQLLSRIFGRQTRNHTAAAAKATNAMRAASG